MTLEPLSRVYYVTEHLGKRSDNGLSRRTVLGNSTCTDPSVYVYWRHASNIAILNSSSPSVMTSASAVARTSLVLDKPYHALALKTSTSEYNCSSLVYRCYINSGLDLSKYGSSIVLPIDIAQNTNLNKVYEYGNFSWR